MLNRTEDQKLLKFIFLINALIFVNTTSFANTLRVSALGQWSENYRAAQGVENGWSWDSFVWFDIAVSKLNFGKTVGIVWTTDNWQTSTTSEASYDGKINDSIELWSLDIKAAELTNCFDCQTKDLVFEYALFVIDGDTEHWNNNSGQNHRLLLSGEFNGDSRDEAAVRREYYRSFLGHEG